MRRYAPLLALALFACSPREAPPALPEAAVNPTWFICDAVDAPRLYVFSRDGDAVQVAEYDKPNGAIIERMSFTLGDGEGAAGSVDLVLLQDGAEAGAIRETNPGMLETPGSAYTPRMSSVRINGENSRCRWLPRTRAMAFTGRRTVVVHEDADGDLIYSTYDTASNSGAAIELSENAVTTPFSLEVRGGEEMVDADGATYSFAHEAFRYVLRVGRDGEGALDVYRDGEDAPIQSEALIAAETGDAAT